MGKKRRTYTPQFRADAVRLVHEQGRSVADVARSLDVQVNTLHRWVKAEEAGHLPAVRCRTPEQEEVARLKRELKRVKGQSPAA